MSITTIDQIRRNLYAWGWYQARQEMGTGFASKSVTYKICEMLKTQIWSSSDLHLFSHLSDSMIEPDHIEQITNAVAKLPKLQRIEIRKKYISKQKDNGKEIDNYHTREAENFLLGVIK
jgi:ribosomal protein S3AE